MNETRLDVGAELARLDQLHTRADRQLQEFRLAPGLYRIKHWKILLATVAAWALLCGGLGAWIGSRPSLPQLIIVIQDQR